MYVYIYKYYNKQLLVDIWCGVGFFPSFYSDQNLAIGHGTKTIFAVFTHFSADISVSLPFNYMGVYSLIIKHGNWKSAI